MAEDTFMNRLTQDADEDGFMDGDLDHDGKISSAEIVAARRSGRHDSLLGDPNKLEETMTQEVEAELRSLRGALRVAQEKEEEMSRLRRLYRGHYRTKYAYLKPHDPSAVLGDHWDIHPSVLADLVSPEKEEELE